MESKEWLINEYITKKRTCNDIAKELNKDPKTIWSWLKKNEIPTRSRGGDSSSGSFKKGSNLWLGKKHKPETKYKIREARIKDGHVPYLRNGEHWLKSVYLQKDSLCIRLKNGVKPLKKYGQGIMQFVKIVVKNITLKNKGSNRKKKEKKQTCGLKKFL